MPSSGVATDPEATLQAAILTAQGGDATGTLQNTLILGGQVSESAPGFPVAGPPVSSPVAGGGINGIQNAPKPQSLSSVNAVLASSPDRQHKVAASDSSASNDASATPEGQPQEQGAKPPMASGVLPQSGPGTTHAGPVAGPLWVAAPAPTHVSLPTLPVPAQSTPTPAAYLAMLQQPEATAAPLVSSASLIQSIQQSDMRVGLQSEEFGAISIHTTTDRGVLSSEITLGHEELAHTLTTHLASMQELPGLPQSFSVRVDTTSTTGGSLASGSEQTSERSQQNETGRATPSRNGGSQPWAQQPMLMATRSFHSNDGLAGRLDIRI